MPMEIEYFPVDSEDLGEVENADISAADMVNGRGEEKVERHEDTVYPDDDIDDIAEALPPSLVEDEYEEVDYGEAVAFESRIRAKIEHEKEIAEAKEAHTAASLARQAAEEVFKAAKATEKACLSELSALINRGPQYPDSNPINQGGESPIDAAVRNDKSSASTPLDDPNADQSWRNIPIAPMLDGIKGMGEKKREAILSLTPTLGDFEDLRGKASQSHKQLYEVMPKGVGRAMADELEERALSAMRKHQLEMERWEREEVLEPATDQPGDGEPDSESVESPS